MEENLELILKYKMTDLEAKAFKLALLWDKMVKTELPEHNIHTHLRRSGDPRKSTLFKYTYKLISETRGLIPDEEYQLYIKAQLQILKAISDGTVHARISPECLVGEKAWKRWRMWKVKYDKISIMKKPETAHVSATETKIKSEIDKTKLFLEFQFGHQPTQEDINKSIKEKLMIKWITVNKVCAYYAILSPFLKKSFGGKTIEEVFLFDLGIYRSSINSVIEEYFRKVFDYEFQPYKMT